MKKINIKKWFVLPLFSALLLASVPSALTAGASGIYLDGEDPLAVLSLLDETSAGADEFRFVQALDVGFGKVYRYQQIRDGLDILGQEVTVSVNKKGKVLSVNGSYLSAETETGTLGEEKAFEAVRSEVGGQIFSAGEIYFEKEGRLIPAYDILSDAEGGTRTVVSEKDGEILLSVPASSYVSVPVEQTNAYGETVSLEVEQDGGQYYLGDETRNIYTYNYQGITPNLYTSHNGVFTDEIAVSVYENTVRAYDFYTNEENIGAVRYGINNGNDLIAGNRDERPSELLIRLYVHYNYDGYRENAAFDTVNAIMFVGDGRPNGDLYRQGKAQDVIAHEFQHGVTHHTAGLVYMGDSGAIDEAISDIFGMLVEGRDPSEEEFWSIGEDAVPDGNALRSVKDPVYPYRSSARNKLTCNLPHMHNDQCDYNGVHYNSTIISSIAYKLWEMQPDFYGKENMGKLWYGTLCALTSRSTFLSFARTIRETAENLGYDEQALETLDRALYASGLSEDPDLHTVTFVNYDGKILKECIVKDGEDAVPPADPSRPASTRYTYTFDGWEGEYHAVTEDVRVTAHFRRDTRYYTVTFLDAEGNVLKEQKVTYGESAEAPDPPKKESDDLYDYEFSLWDRSFRTVHSDLTVRPVFHQYLCYKVYFLSEGQQIGTVRVREKQAATPPPAPQKQSTAESDFIFDHWEGNYSYVTQNTTVNAVFRETPRQYVLSYQSEGGSFEQTIGFGETYTLPTPEPREGYRFAGWYLDETLRTPASNGTVSGDMTFYAKWQNTNVPILIAVAVCAVVLLGGAVTAGVLLGKRKKTKQ